MYSVHRCFCDERVRITKADSRDGNTEQKPLNDKEKRVLPNRCLPASLILQETLHSIRRAVSRRVHRPTTPRDFTDAAFIVAFRMGGVDIVSHIIVAAV